MLPDWRIEAGWADLVFHVLAHVKLSDRPWDLYDGGYVEWVEQQLGAARERALGRDAAALARLLGEADAGITVQSLAVLFSDTTHAMQLAERELSELRADDVARPEYLPSLAQATSASELLRSAVLLEAPYHALLPPSRPEITVDGGLQRVAADDGPLQDAISRVCDCAPRLNSCKLALSRALTCHGRLFGHQIYIGLPDVALGVSPEHVALQAAHEATVHEAQARGPALGERAIEAVAVAVLAQRAARVGLSQLHAAWAEQLDVRAEHCELDRLPATERELARSLLDA